MVMTSTIAMLCEIDQPVVRATIADNGAVLIRSPGATLQHFTGLSDELMTPMVHHATNTIERDPVNDDPRTSTVNKGMDAIPLHRETSYAPGCPDALMLYCERPASIEGQTLLCDGAELLRRLPNAIRDFVADLDLYWSWEASSERWSQTFGVTDTDQARLAIAQVRKMLKPYEDLEVKFVGETLHGRFRTKCTIPSWGSGIPSFCNSLMIYAYREQSEYYARDKFRVTLENGTPFPAEMLAEIRTIADNLCYSTSWKSGDIVIIDNSRFMHGRQAFSDPDRRILIRMGYLR